jgi:L-threonylcarbamoyladenylate synthase
VHDWIANAPESALARAGAIWPGAHTFIFPRSPRVPEWVAGGHAGIALRVTAHPVAAALCRAFGDALVSTSANPHAEPPARDAATVRRYFHDGIDSVVDAPPGGAARPTSIRDALTGAIIRA